MSQNHKLKCLDTMCTVQSVLHGIFCVAGSRYMVVDCGGGTVDITVHQVDKGEKLIELYRASGGPHGSVGKV